MKIAPFPSLCKEDHRDDEGYTAAVSRTQDLNYYSVDSVSIVLHNS